MDFSFSEETGLWGLLAASFLAATILPVSSEAVLIGFLKFHPHAVAGAITVATLGNTLGGMTSYALGRLLPRDSGKVRQLERVRKYGAPILVLAWLPIIGDALCVAAGWLRVPWLAAVLAQVIGRGARYALIGWLTGAAS